IQPAGDTVVSVIGPTLYNKIKTLTTECNVTTMMFLFSVYNILLSGYSVQEDLMVGIVTSGRRHADLEDIVGFFVNMLAIRTAPNETKTFAGYLAEVREKSIDGYENQEYQFEELVARLQPQREPGRHPLVDAVFVMKENSEDAESRESNESEVNPFKLSRFDLMLHASANAGSVDLSFEFSTLLFKKETIRELSNYYTDILEQVTSDKDILLRDIRVTHGLATAESTIAEDESDWL
ncbi:MAG: hypothetical protein GY940_00990, partial [bacterium]|nr:hypothetical protein [bacterium]